MLSIIIPLHNKGPYVDATLASLLSQNWENWEALVVENGSTDDGPERVRQWQRRDPRIHLIEAPRDVRGPGAARNFGIDHAKGQWIQYLDADDLILEGHFEKQCNAAKANPSCSVIVCDWLEGRDLDVRTGTRMKPTVLDGGRALASYAIAFTPWVIHSAWIATDLVRRHRWNTILDRGIGEDHEYWFRILLYSEVHYSPHAGVYYLLETTGRRHIKGEIEHYVKQVDRLIEANLATLEQSGKRLRGLGVHLFRLYLSLADQARREGSAAAERSCAGSMARFTPRFTESLQTGDFGAAICAMTGGSDLHAPENVSQFLRFNVMIRPLFSVVVPVFNQEKYIVQTLESVRAQTMDDFEIIVVDDGSTDRSVEAVREFGHPVRIVLQENRGPGAARNHGVSVATGKYITFLDGDDLWFPWTLEHFRKGLDANSGCEWVVGRCVQFHDDSEMPSIIHNASRGGSSASYQRIRRFYETSTEYFEIYTGEFAIRREVFLRSGGYNEDMMNLEDGDLYLRLGADIPMVEITRPPVFCYRRRQGSTSGNIEYAWRACLRVLENERKRLYPGGSKDDLARLRIITRYVRPVVLDAIRRGRLDLAWELFLKCWTSNLRVGKCRFVLGVPLLIARKRLLELARTLTHIGRATD